MRTNRLSQQLIAIFVTTTLLTGAAAHPVQSDLTTGLPQTTIFSEEALAAPEATNLHAFDPIGWKVRALTPHGIKELDLSALERTDSNSTDPHLERFREALSEALPIAAGFSDELLCLLLGQPPDPYSVMPFLRTLQDYASSRQLEMTWSLAVVHKIVQILINFQHLAARKGNSSQLTLRQRSLFPPKSTGALDPAIAEQVRRLLDPKHPACFDPERAERILRENVTGRMVLQVPQEPTMTDAMKNLGAAEVLWAPPSEGIPPWMFLIEDFLFAFVVLNMAPGWLEQISVGNFRGWSDEQKYAYSVVRSLQRTFLAIFEAGPPPGDEPGLILTTQSYADVDPSLIDAQLHAILNAYAVPGTRVLFTGIDESVLREHLPAWHRIEVVHLIPQQTPLIVVQVGSRPPQGLMTPREDFDIPLRHVERVSHKLEAVEKRHGLAVLVYLALLQMNPFGHQLTFFLAQFLSRTQEPYSIPAIQGLIKMRLSPESFGVPFAIAERFRFVPGLNEVVKLAGHKYNNGHWGELYALNDLAQMNFGLGRISPVHAGLSVQGFLPGDRLIAGKRVARKLADVDLVYEKAPLPEAPEKKRYVLVEVKYDQFDPANPEHVDSWLESMRTQWTKWASGLVQVLTHFPSIREQHPELLDLQQAEDIVFAVINNSDNLDILVPIAKRVESEVLPHVIQIFQNAGFMQPVWVTWYNTPPLQSSDQWTELHSYLKFMGTGPQESGLRQAPEAIAGQWHALNEQQRLKFKRHFLGKIRPLAYQSESVNSFLMEWSKQFGFEIGKIFLDLVLTAAGRDKVLATLREITPSSGLSNVSPLVDMFLAQIQANFDAVLAQIHQNFHRQLRTAHPARRATPLISA